MSRLEQSSGTELLRNPSSKFLEFKNVYGKEEVTIKGKKKEVKVFEECKFVYAVKEGEEWVQHDVKLPLEFAVINGDWVNFKGWNETEKCKYYSNEVKGPDDIISLRNKDGVVFEFTLNEMWGRTTGSKVKDEVASKKVKSILKGYGVKQHSSIYIGVRSREDDSFDLMNLQIRGANLSGIKEPEKNVPSGWWNVSRKYKQNNLLYTNFMQINDWTVEDGELGEYAVLNWTIGDKIDAEDNERLDLLFDNLAAYHKYYLNKPKEEEVKTESKTESKPVEKDEPHFAEDIDDDLPF